MFDSESMRDGTLELQTLAAEHGLGPPVGPSVTIPGYLDYAWGYFTRVAEVMPRPNFNKDSGKCVYPKGYDALERRFQSIDRKRLKRMCKKIGFTAGDMHEYNLGFFEGEPVIVDFDSDRNWKCEE